MPKGNAIPAKFEPSQEAALHWVAKKSGLNVSEVIRRAIFLLNAEVQRRGGDVSWIVKDLAPDIGPMPTVEVPAYSLQEIGSGLTLPSKEVAKTSTQNTQSSPLQREGQTSEGAAWPPDAKLVKQEVPARTVHGTNLHGGSTHSLNEEPPPPSATGPKPKSTAGIRRMARKNKGEG